MDSKPEFCVIYVKAKVTQKPFLKKSTSDRVKIYGDKVSADMWRPAQVESLGEKQYYMKRKSTLCVTNPSPWTTTNNMKHGLKYNEGL